MKNDEIDDKSRKAHDAVSPSPIPGDPFPWEPDPLRALEAGEAAAGSTPSPADSGDLNSYDLGGGD